MNHLGCDCSRRSFLKGGGLMLAGVGLGTFLPAEVLEHALADSATGRRLLFLYLSGGCDVINTVIPHGDPDYNATTRPTLYIGPEQALDLNGFASLHPRLDQLREAFDAGDLAVVHRVGYPAMSLSHFDGYKIWHGGAPAQIDISDGWLYRYIASNAVSAGVPLPVVTVNGVTPAVVSGTERFVNIGNPGNFDYIHDAAARDKYRAAWRDVFGHGAGLERFRPLLSATGVKLLDVTEQYRLWDQAAYNPRDPNGGEYLFPVDAVTDPAQTYANYWSYFQNLRVAVLALLESDGRGNGTRVAGLELGGFDTHDGQGRVAGAHPDLLRVVARSVRAVRTALSGAALDNRGYAAVWDDTAFVTFSEFGRTSRENGSRGTDHGQATFSLVAGGRVNGGVYNCDAATWEPGALFAVDGSYLAHRTDYRALFWEILRDHMGAAVATADAVFPGYTGAGLQELNLF